MSESIFLTTFDDGLPPVGSRCALSGAEAHHAVSVRRIEIGEYLVLTDGAGTAVAGPVVDIAKKHLTIEVVEHRNDKERPIHWTVVQAIPKGDRGELAVDLLTEQGVTEIIPWEAQRCMVRWKAERGTKALARWRATAREAAKQSRRLRIPTVSDPIGIDALCQRVRSAAAAIVLHESATTSLAGMELPKAGEVLFVVGPEGGITDAELAMLTDAGARVVIVSDGVLRTSTAGIVGLAQAQLLVADDYFGHA